MKTGHAQFGVLLSSADEKEDVERVIVDIAAISIGKLKAIGDVLLDFQGGWCCLLCYFMPSSICLGLGGQLILEGHFHGYIMSICE